MSREVTGIAHLRLRELRIIFQHRYGHTLPDDDAGREDLAIALDHAAGLSGDPRQRMMNFASIWAPWIDPDELEDMIENALRNGQRWTADALADQLGLTESQRKDWAIKTIGIAGMHKAERVVIQKARKRVRDRDRKRLKQAAKARAERGCPWEKSGISRATFYRRKLNGHKPWLWDNSPRAEALLCPLDPDKWMSASELANKVKTWPAFRGLSRAALMRAVYRGLDELKKAGRIEDRHEQIDGRDVRFARRIVMQ
jgi:hypothetical protein